MNKTPICPIEHLRITDSWRPDSKAQFFQDLKDKRLGKTSAVDERPRRNNGQLMRKFKVADPKGVESIVYDISGLAVFFDMSIDWVYLHLKCMKPNKKGRVVKELKY